MRGRKRHERWCGSVPGDQLNQTFETEGGIVNNYIYREVS